MFKLLINNWFHNRRVNPSVADYRTFTILPAKESTFRSGLKISVLI
jgi:hypothetical protein